ncbi:MAG: ATP-binding protein [Gammaproteobacteria bacterium]|nr:ATP-binding protein [Gammaproteobacteria bacterium]
MNFDHEELTIERFLSHTLEQWKSNPHKKPILLRGARQVGKTHLVRSIGRTFDEFVEINFEYQPAYQKIFEQDLDPKRILKELRLMTEKRIEPNHSLLFLDEIQANPKAIQALRYFYEEMPELHVIAAGSLLNFAIESVGVPVGRVSFLYLYPVSFIEFLKAAECMQLLKVILTNDVNVPLAEPVHNKALRLVGEYIAIGGMPEVVKTWLETSDYGQCHQILHELVGTFRQDFEKYAKRYQIKYIEQLFNTIPRQLGCRFKYSHIEGNFRKRELAPCLSLLEKADIVHPIYHTAAQGLPLGAETNLGCFKLKILDVALAQAILGSDLKKWVLDPLSAYINKGEIAESFVGQELLAYSSPHQKQQLYYWHKESRSSQAEVDYVASMQGNIIPIEVKSGKGSSLKSMHLFLDKHPSSPYGIRYSTHNYSVHNQLQSYPLYAVSKTFIEENPSLLHWLNDAFCERKPNE